MIKAAEIGLRLLQKMSPWNISAGLHSTGPAQHLATPDHPDIRTARQICRLASPGRLGLSLEVREKLGSSYAFSMEDSAATRLPSEPQHQRVFLAEPVMRSDDPMPRGLDLDPVPAVAVIPFLTLTTDATFQHLGDIIADELIASLCRRKEIRVISRLSTKAFKADQDNSRDIRHFLGASFGATGTCTIVGDQLKVLVEFVDFGQNETIWTETLRCPLGAALATDGIVDEVAARIIATILRKSVEIVRQQPLPKLENSALLLGAITLMHQLTPERFGTSKMLLTTLAERCPNHPAPHAWLGMYQLLKVSQGWSANPADDARLGREFTAKALDADPDHAVALSVSAHISTQFDHDFESGGSALERALLVEPSNGLGWLFSSARHAFLGEGSDAIKAASIASGLSPLDPRRWFYDSLASTAALGANDYDAAIALGKRSLQGNGLHTSTYRALIIAMQLSGRHSEAAAMATRFMRLQPQFSVAQYRRTHPTLQTRVGTLWADALRAAGLPE